MFNFISDFYFKLLSHNMRLKIQPPQSTPHQWQTWFLSILVSSSFWPSSNDLLNPSMNSSCVNCFSSSINLRHNHLSLESDACETSFLAPFITFDRILRPKWPFYVHNLLLFLVLVARVKSERSSCDNEYILKRDMNMKHLQLPLLNEWCWVWKW